MDHRSAEDVRHAWGRVTAWLDHHDPVAFAALGCPGSPAAIREAERRMGLTLPQQTRRWLLATDLDAGRRPRVGSCLVALGCSGVIPSGGLLLGLVDIERVYSHNVAMQEMTPSEDTDCPSWRRTWVPILSESDGA